MFRAVVLGTVCTGWVLSGAVVASANAAESVLISEWAGAGPHQARLVVNFADGAAYAFGYRFDGPLTGLGLLQGLDAPNTGLDVQFQDFGWGVFVDGMAYAGHANAGYGGGENWWHYWLSDDGIHWTMSMYGAADRSLPDGAWDGWTYGSAAPPTVPVPEPTAAVSMALSAMLACRRKCRGRSMP